jgi:hypothetical protein
LLPTHDWSVVYVGIINGNNSPIASVMVGELDNVGEIYYTQIKQNITPFFYNTFLDVGICLCVFKGIITRDFGAFLD